MTRQRLLLQLLALVLCGGLSAQGIDPAMDHLERFWKTIGTSRSYRATVRITEAQSRSGRVVHVSEARSYRKGELFRAEMGGMTNLAAREYYLVLDENEKVMMVRGKSATTPQVVTDPMDQWKQMIRQMGTSAQFCKVEQEDARQVVLRLEDPRGALRNVLFTLRKSDHMPVSLTYDLVDASDLDFDQVRIQYIEMAVDCPLDDKLFDIGRFVQFRQGGVVPVAAYRDYQVKYIPAS